jgi:hypothetical protein
VMAAVLQYNTDLVIHAKHSSKSAGIDGLDPAYRNHTLA